MNNENFADSRHNNEHLRPTNWRTWRRNLTRFAWIYSGLLGAAVICVLIGVMSQSRPAVLAWGVAGLAILAGNLLWTIRAGRKGCFMRPRCYRCKARLPDTADDCRRADAETSSPLS